jgi:hypothetical protein
LRADEDADVETVANRGVPFVVAASSSGGLLVGYPDAAVEGAGLGCFEGEDVGGSDGREVVEVICKYCVCKGFCDGGEVEWGGQVS